MTDEHGFKPTGQGQGATAVLDQAPPGSAAPQPAREITIGKARVPAEANGRPTTVEIFIMTLGGESIYLLPLKTWSQLDVYKWRVQGKLPATPAGLEVAVDHVKVGGQTVRTYEADGCEKLERALNDWLALERQAVGTLAMLQ